MSFVDSIKTCFTKYVDFSGRARRSEFWWFYLFTSLASALAMGIGNAINAPFISGLVSLALLLPNLAVTVRRLHDLNKKWVWILIELVPVVGWIILIVMLVKEGTQGDNDFGPDPKAAA
ncbi:MAG: DUF805 domain-containing protein [Lachnospiraceae bacterium]|nr:DUF805 domain-containing protein [Lachnospiraceae bacterium]